LLRVLQTGEFERLGSNATRRTRVRVIAATNSNPAARHSRGPLPGDLLYRLNVIELEIPALIDRLEDIGALARHFLEPGSHSRRMHWTRSHATRGRVMSGNCRTRFAARACCHPTKRSRRPLSFSRSSRCSRRPDETALDRSTVEQALERAQGVVAQAARELGLSRQALYRRMEKLGLKA